MRPNPALNLAPFGRWTLRDQAAQRRLALRYASPIAERRRADSVAFHPILLFASGQGRSAHRAAPMPLRRSRHQHSGRGMSYSLPALEIRLQRTRGACQSRDMQCPAVVVAGRLVHHLRQTNSSMSMPCYFSVVVCLRHNPALNLVRFAHWTRRDAARRLALR